ncbi:MAG: outer membrane beta-barrel protein [Gemmatimonadaceae bacterium]
MAYRRIFALAFVVPLVVTATAHAQDTTRTRDTTRTVRRDTTMSPTRTTLRDTTMSPRARSQQRIRLRKSSGEVDLPPTRDSAAVADSMRADSVARAERARQDSVARQEQMQRDSLAAIERARTDSIARIEKARQDSIAVIERARQDSIARADSIAKDAQLRAQRQRDRYLFNGTGWYIGVAGGSAMPNGDFKDIGYKNGFNVEVPIGYHKRNQLLGARLDLGYSQFSGQSFTVAGPTGPTVLQNVDPKVWSAVLNLTARFPLNASRSVALYGVGGGGAYHFRSYGATSALGGFLGNDVVTPGATVKLNRTEFGVQGGGGIEFGVGPTSLYVEGRMVQVLTDRKDETAFRMSSAVGAASRCAGCRS